MRGKRSPTRRPSAGCLLCIHDVEGARQNGLPVVGVLWGYGDAQELTGATRLVAAPGELTPSALQAILT